MTRSRILPLLLLLGALAASGCVVRARGGVYAPAPAVVVVEEEPPPPRVEVWTARPGFVWVDGYWVRRGPRWHWHAGYYQRQRAGHVWRPGVWQRRGRGHVYIQGRWEAGGGGKVRVDNHRRDKGYRGPVIRDHRK